MTELTMVRKAELFDWLAERLVEAKSPASAVSQAIGSMLIVT